MLDSFRTAIAEVLPSAEAVHSRLSILPYRDRVNVAGYFSSALPEVDVLITTPGAESLTHELSRLRGVPSVSLARVGGRWLLVGGPLEKPGQIRPLRQQVQAAVISLELEDGLPELAALILADHQSWQVAAIAAAVQRTDESGHVRLSLLNVPVISPVVLAGTPQGLVFERRLPGLA
ncbi:hypothetical protein [Deinococcus radiotolerans]|uniref:Uncharacterized protein n=1 Tax=Deinococcus radiotolerans TaxID=1309407 RepID=A0ABQ2FEL1_9DEIO|nr:hypothetical protein [Deinococcus radiotolerans]GGK90684.1 hypothetical protein GCM10010844_06550 [Deinococcus radiotolerans]